MKDYILQIRIKNGPMLRALRASGYATVAALSRDCGVSEKMIGCYLNLRYAPLNKKGEFREDIQTIAAYLHTSAEDLFPPQHMRRALAKTTGEIEASIEDVETFLPNPDADPQRQLERRDIVAQLVAAVIDLPDRERQVITMRYGLDGEGEHTLEQCGDAIGGITRERVRQIELKALRKLHHPAHWIGTDLSSFG